MKSLLYLSCVSTSENIMSMELCRFWVKTPTRVTSAGKTPVALETRFWTLTAAMSGSVPILKVIWMEAAPVFVADELM